MIVRSLGRGAVFLGRAVYLLSAIAAISALSFGLVTATLGGVAADALAAWTPIGAKAPPRAVAGGVTVAVAGVVFLSVAVRSFVLDPGRPARRIRGWWDGVASAVRGFRSEWSAAALEPARSPVGRRSRRRTRLDSPLGPAQRRAGPLLGHRLWVVGPAEDGGGAALVAPVTGRTWTGAVLEAGCSDEVVRELSPRGFRPHRSPAPALECMCGIYALKRSLWPAPRHRSPLASGRVELTGTVIEGSRGYRAQRAEVVGPLRVSLACAGSVENGLWTERAGRGWEPVSPGPCPFEPIVLAVGIGEYVGFCAMHARHARGLLGEVPTVEVWALQSQLELRYGVEVEMAVRGTWWT